MDLKKVGDGEVVLIAGGDKIYTDIAARFVGSDRELQEIIASPFNKNIVKNIIDSGHEAALEFDYFIFGVAGYSRVTEVQLVRKRIASYMIKSGRVDKDEHEFSLILPPTINPNSNVEINGEKIPLKEVLKGLEKWYNEYPAPDEDLRYLKPQATEFKGIIGMNAHALRDWFRIRCCLNAQEEIRDMANKMLRLCKKAAPSLFEDAGANCVRMGYCPENDFQHPSCKVIKKKDALEIIKNNEV